MNYNELTKGQRRCVDTFISIKPDLASSSSISRATVEEVWNIALKNRDAGGPKFAYPMWLVKGPKVSRGVYQWPSPNVTHTITKPALKEMTEEDKEFYAELRSFGINI